MSDKKYILVIKQLDSDTIADAVATLCVGQDDVVNTILRYAHENEELIVEDADFEAEEQYIREEMDELDGEVVLDAFENEDSTIGFEILIKEI